MDLQIVGVFTDPNEGEYLRLKVLTNNCKLNNYLVHDNTYSGKKVSNRSQHYFRFPLYSKPVKEKDYIRLYSCEGKSGTRPNTEETTTHEFYWGLDHEVWNNANDVAHLINIADSRSKRVKQKTTKSADKKKTNTVAKKIVKGRV